MHTGHSEQKTWSEKKPWAAPRLEAVEMKNTAGGAIVDLLEPEFPNGVVS